jgi:TetR/AcrR family transcriptional regulator
LRIFIHTELPLMEEEMQTVKLSRKERELQRHRHEILKAALKIFSEGGFHGVTMQDIASEAEFAVGTLYKFFKNKEDLYRVLLVEKVEDIRNILVETIKSGIDEMDSLRKYLNNLIRLVKKDEKFFRIFLSEIHGTTLNVPIESGEELKNSREQSIKMLASVFKEGSRKKIFKDLDPYLLATAFDGIISNFILQYFMHGDRHPFDADIIMEIFFETILLDKPD